MKAKPKNRSEQTDTLTRYDWDFSGVPDEELAACVVWEYARESETLQLHTGGMAFWWKSLVVRPGETEGSFVKNTPEEQQQAAEVLKRLREKFGYDPDRVEKSILTAASTELVSLFRTADRIPWEVYTWLRHYGSLSAPPWRKLPPDACKWLSRSTVDNVLQDGSFFDLKEFLQANDRVADMGRTVPRETLAEAFRDTDSLKPAEVFKGWIVAALRINVAGFSRAQIVRGFETWLDGLPEDWRPSREGKTRGKDSVEWRARLERLGLLRLRSRYTFEKAQPFLVKLGHMEKFRNPGECNREAKKAVKDFHSLFPFLDPAENPRSWPLLE